MKKRIFFGFIALIVLFGTLSAVLVSSIISTVIPQQVQNRLNEEMTLLTTRMAQVPEAEAIESLISTSRITHIAADGTVLFDSKSAEPLLNHADREEVQEALKTGSGSAVRYSDTMRANMIYVAKRMADGSVMRLAAPERASFEMADSMMPWLVFGTIGLVIFCLPLAVWFSNLLMKPILQIDLDRPEDSVVYDEVMPLVRRIDEQAKLNREQMAALERRRQELDTLLSGMNEGFIALDKSQRILMINPSACRILGIDQDQALNKTLPEVNRSPEMLSLLEQLAADGCASGMMKKDHRSYLLSASQVERREGAVLLISDQTDKVEGEAMRKRFTANVSHELRTPLTTICGYAETIDKGMVKPEDIPGFNATILREGRRMMSLVEDILRLSQLDEGLPQGKRERVSLLEAAKAACESLKPLAKDKKVSLSLEGEEVHLNGDPDLLQEMCINLVDNAIKYNTEGGEVKVSVQPLVDEAILSVADSGIGIEKEHQTRIFERFYRTDSSRSKATGGTGLGLSIVKHAAEYHGAKISLDSIPGQGTTIRLSFPRVS